MHGNRTPVTLTTVPAEMVAPHVVLLHSFVGIGDFMLNTRKLTWAPGVSAFGSNSATVTTHGNPVLIWPWVGGQVEVALRLLQVGPPRAVIWSGTCEPVAPLHESRVNGMLPDGGTPPLPPVRLPLPSSVKIPLDAGKPGIELRPRPLAASQPDVGSPMPPLSVPAANLPLHSRIVTPCPGVPPKVGALTSTMLGVAQAGPYGAVLKLQPSALLRTRLTSFSTPLDLTLMSWRPLTGSDGAAGLPSNWCAPTGPARPRAAAPTSAMPAARRRCLVSFTYSLRG